MLHIKFLSSFDPILLAVLILCELESQENFHSNFIISRKPKRCVKAKQREQFTQILPDYLSKQFAKARNRSGYFDKQNRENLPTFHEIRSLGAKLYEEQGVPKQIIQSLLGHSHVSMTNLYLDRYDVKWEEVN